MFKRCSTSESPSLILTEDIVRVEVDELRELAGVDDASACLVGLTAAVDGQHHVRWLHHHLYRRAFQLDLNQLTYTHYETSTLRTTCICIKLKKIIQYSVKYASSVLLMWHCGRMHIVQLPLDAEARKA